MILLKLLLDSLLWELSVNQHQTLLFSVVIMPSEIGGEKKKEVQQQQQQLSITYPQVSQSYRCIETFETKDTKNRSFNVAKKEIVEVLLKDMTGRFDSDPSISGMHAERFLDCFKARQTLRL